MVAFTKKEKLASMGAIQEFLDLPNDNEEDLLTGGNREERKCMAEQAKNVVKKSYIL